jgi:hypothetical protein
MARRWFEEGSSMARRWFEEGSKMVRRRLVKVIGSAASSARLRRFAFSAKNTCCGRQKRPKVERAF